MNYRHPDEQYLDLLRDVMKNGVVKDDRTGTGTRSVFSRTMRFDISDGKIPLLTTKFVNTKSIIHELLWFLKGDTNIRYLKENGVGIWDSWVITGTEEYEDIGYEVLYKTLCQKFGCLDLRMEVREFSNHDNPEWQFLTSLTPGKSSEELAASTGTIIFRQDIWERMVKDSYLETVEGVVKYLSTQVGVSTKKLIAGDLGPVYGKQWRAWEDIRLIPYDEGGINLHAFRIRYPDFNVVGEVEKMDFFEYTHTVVRREIDQIAKIIDQLKNNPDSRRIILNAWNVAQIDEMGLPPCHLLLQFYTRVLSVGVRKRLLDKKLEDGSDIEWMRDGEQIDEFLDRQDIPRRALSAELRCRSQDMPLGTPFNIAQYGVLIHMIAQVVGMATDEFIWSGGDCHIYSDQVDGVKKQLSRDPLWDVFPRVKLNPTIKNIDDFKFEDIVIEGYDPNVIHPVIKFPPAAV